MNIEKKQIHRAMQPLHRMQRTYFIKTMAMFFLPFLILIIVIGCVSIWLVQTYVISAIDLQNQTQLSKFSSEIDSRFDELDQLNAFLTNNPAIKLRLKQAILKMDENGGVAFDDYAVINAIIEMIYVFIGTNDNIDSLYIYFNNDDNWFIFNNQFLKLEECFDKEWKSAYLNHDPNDRIWFEFRTIENYQFRKKKKDVFTIYSRIYSSAKANADGVIVLNMDLESLETSVSDLPSANEAVIRLVTQDGITMMQTNDISSTDEYSVYFMDSSAYGWKYEYLIPESVNYRIPNIVTRIIVFVCLMVLFIGFLVSLSESRQNYSRIMELVKIIKFAKEGKELPNYGKSKSDLFNYIMQNIVRSFVLVDYLHVQVLERKYYAEAQELIALRSQLNIHFLYNTLQTILWKTISLTNGPNDASMMIEMFSDILQYALDKNDGEMTLCKEIEITEAYLSLQKIRYKDRLSSSWDVLDLRTDEISFPKLIFQPLVENSITHGMKENGESLRIRIEIRKIKADVLRIRIVDNGRGIDKRRLKFLRKSIYSKKEISGSHLGFSNTCRRLRSAFGSKLKIFICSSEGKGTIITLFVGLN